jgi:hypothetical protein
MSFIETMGLHAEGFTDDQIAQIEGVKDDLLHVVATYQAVKPRIDRIVPVIRMVLEVINQKGTTA